MSDVRVQVDAEAFNDAIRQYVKRLGIDMPKAVRTQGRLFFKYAIDRTPPKTRAEGRKRVAQQIAKAVGVLDAKNFDDVGIRNLIKARNYEVLSRIFPGRGVVPFEPKLHQQARDNRGRVRKATGFLTPDKDKVREYVRATQEHVGRARGGWAAAYAAVGGRPSAWIANWSKLGRVEQRLDDPVAASIEGENFSEWAAHGDDQRIIADVMQARTQAILTDIELRLARAAEAASKQ